MAIHQSLGIRAEQLGKKFASGTQILSADDHEIVTGLTTVDHCGGSLAAPPTITHTISIFSPHATAGSIQIRSYKPTSTANPSPIDATTPWSVVNWWAIGD